MPITSRDLDALRDLSPAERALALEGLAKVDKDLAKHDARLKALAAEVRRLKAGAFERRVADELALDPKQDKAALVRRLAREHRDEYEERSGYLAAPEDQR